MTNENGRIPPEDDGSTAGGTPAEGEIQIRLLGGPQGDQMANVTMEEVKSGAIGVPDPEHPNRTLRYIGKQMQVQVPVVVWVYDGVEPQRIIATGGDDDGGA